MLEVLDFSITDMGIKPGVGTFGGAVEEEGVDLVWCSRWSRYAGHYREEAVELFKDGGLGLLAKRKSAVSEGWRMMGAASLLRRIP